MQKAITNTGSGPMYVAGRMIPPGETIVLDEADLPPEHREPEPPPVEQAPKDRLAEIAEMPVKLIIAILADLNDEELDRMKAIEEADKQRKTLIAAIDEAKLERASQALDAVKADPEAVNPDAGGNPAPEGAGE